MKSTASHDLTLPENPAWPQVEAAVVDFARGVAAVRRSGQPARAGQGAYTMKSGARRPSGMPSGARCRLLVVWVAGMLAMPIVQWASGSRA